MVELSQDKTVKSVTYCPPKDIKFTLNSVNAPTGVKERSIRGLTIGSLTSHPNDRGITYSLVSGEGDTHNSYFYLNDSFSARDINNFSVLINKEILYTKMKTAQIRVRATSVGGTSNHSTGYTEKSFSIPIVDMPSPFSCGPENMLEFHNNGWLQHTSFAQIKKDSHGEFKPRKEPSQWPDAYWGKSVCAGKSAQACCNMDLGGGTGCCGYQVEFDNLWSYDYAMMAYEYTIYYQFHPPKRRGVHISRIEVDIDVKSFDLPLSGSGPAKTVNWYVIGMGAQGANSGWYDRNRSYYGNIGGRGQHPCQNPVYTYGNYGQDKIVQYPGGVCVEHGGGVVLGKGMNSGSTSMAGVAMKFPPGEFGKIRTSDTSNFIGGYGRFIGHNSSTPYTFTGIAVKFYSRFDTRNSYISAVKSIRVWGIESCY